MAKLILTGSIDVSHCVHCILAGFLSGEAGGAFAPPPPMALACPLLRIFICMSINSSV